MYTKLHLFKNLQINQNDAEFTIYHILIYGVLYTKISDYFLLLVILELQTLHIVWLKTYKISTMPSYEQFTMNEKKNAI